MRHLLVVEDDPAVCSVMQMGLEADGSCRVTSAESARAALHIALDDRPDAAIIDAALPEVHGLALTRAVVGLEIPVLITSGDPALQERMVEVGCPFLVKPFGISQLVAETRQLLDTASERMAELVASLDRMLNTRRELAFVIEQSRRLVEESRRLRAERSKPGSAALSSRAALFDSLLGEAIATTRADMGTLHAVDATTNTLRIVASRGFGATFLDFFAVVGNSGDSACGLALREGRRVVVPAVARSEFIGRTTGRILHDAGVHAVQSTPIFGAGGCVVGVISTHWARIALPTDGELAQVDEIAHRAAKVIDPLCGRSPLRDDTVVISRKK
jgi:DNA-binding response OmpR family regulator